MPAVLLYLKTILLLSSWISLRKLSLLFGVANLHQSLPVVYVIRWLNAALHISKNNSPSEISHYEFDVIFNSGKVERMAPIVTNVCDDLNCSVSNFNDGTKISEHSKPKNQDSKHTLFSPLVVAFVGLPGRGKSVTAEKLSRYLRWNNHSAKVFSISEFRRRFIETYESHDIFSQSNHEAVEILKKSSIDAMASAAKWLAEGGEIAVLDGTHDTHDKRQRVHDVFAKKLGYKVMFLECVCQNENIISRNFEETLQNSPDYQHMNKMMAMDDLKQKVEHYKERYETMSAKTEPNFSFIKIVDEGENINLHRISGELQSKVLSFITNFKLTPRTWYFSRHGESENNVLGRIGGDTDLSSRGKMYAKAVAKYICDREIPDLHVWTSQLQRTKQTVMGIHTPSENLEALNELYAGICEGLTYEEMQEKFPTEFAWRDQDKLRYRYPWGESYIDVMARLGPVLAELEGSEENILVVSHQAVLRCILGYFLNKQPEELPYFNVPLHTLIKLTRVGFDYCMEFIKLDVDCVDTYRKQPKNCSSSRSTDDALLTVPAHFESLKIWPDENLMPPN